MISQLVGRSRREKPRPLELSLAALHVHVYHLYILEKIMLFASWELQLWCLFGVEHFCPIKLQLGHIWRFHQISSSSLSWTFSWSSYCIHCKKPVTAPPKEKEKAPQTTLQRSSSSLCPKLHTTVLHSGGLTLWVCSKTKMCSVESLKPPHPQFIVLVVQQKWKGIIVVAAFHPWALAKCGVLAT